MQINIINHVEKTSKIDYTPFSAKKWLSFHFGAWGWYKIIKESKNKYLIYDTFENILNYTLIFYEV